MPTITERAAIQHDQLIPLEEQPQNRAGVYSPPVAQRMILERLFAGLYPEVWKDIQETEEWEQIRDDEHAALHREQFLAFVQRFAEDPRIAVDVVAEQYRPTNPSLLGLG